MFFFENEINITKIILACCVLPGTSKTVHTNRPSHGIALVLHDENVIYKFSDDKTVICSYGDCIYLPKNSSYTVQANIDTQTPWSKSKNVIYCINFLVDTELDNDPYKLTADEIGDFVGLYSKAERFWKRKSIAYEEMCRSALYEIIAMLKRLYSRKLIQSKNHEILSPALRYIADNFLTETIKIGSLAKLCGISETYFRKLFAKEFDFSATVYIRNKRLAYSKELLDSGDYSITDACMLSGFNDTSYFSREFKKHFNISPSLYRQGAD